MASNISRLAQDARTRIGVDTGGTFTDFVCWSEKGMVVHKLRSTPADPSRAIIDGVQELDTSGAPLEVVHGSTVATNAVLERKGARVALVVTEGFEDVLCIGRQTRPELYNFFVVPRRPLVERELIFGVRERLEASGRALVAVDSRAVKTLMGKLRRGKQKGASTRGSTPARGIEIVAVCFLHSYANPAH